MSIPSQSTLESYREATAQSVPSSGNMSDRASSLDSILRGIMPGVSDDLMRRALTPSFTQHQLSVPGSFTKPIPEFQPGQLDHREVVGKGNARAQGIGNSVIALANVTGKIMNQKQKNRQYADATRVSQLLEAQQAIDAAQEAIKQDPNNAEAKQALEKNLAIRNGMFEDKKFVSTIQKGFNISFTDPEANKTPDHATVQQGIQMAKERAASYGQQWADKQPVKPTPNLFAQQQMNQAIAQQNAYAKVYAAVLPKILAQKDAMVRTQYVQGMQNLRAMNNHIFDAWKLGQQFQHDQTMAGLRHQYKLGEIASTIQLGGQKALELFQSEQLDPTKLFQTETQFTEKIAGVESNLNTALSNTIQKLASASNQLRNADRSNKVQMQQAVDQLQYQVKSLQQQQQNLQDFKKSWYGVMGNLKQISAGMGGSVDNGAGTGASVPGGAGQPAGAGPNTFDPSALLYGSPFQYGAAPSTSAVLPSGFGGEEGSSDSEDDNPDE